MQSKLKYKSATLRRWTDLLGVHRWQRWGQRWRAGNMLTCCRAVPVLRHSVPWTRATGAGRRWGIWVWSWSWRSSRSLFPGGRAKERQRWPVPVGRADEVLPDAGHLRCAMLILSCAASNATMHGTIHSALVAAELKLCTFDIFWNLSWKFEVCVLFDTPSLLSNEPWRKFVLWKKYRKKVLQKI